jgi:hypothetical protein
MPFDYGKKRPDGQYERHPELPKDERDPKAFVRPVRRSYRHLICGGMTSMPQSIAETYARAPAFYGATFCARCGNYFPVGADGEFVWDGTSEKVGT